MFRSGINVPESQAAARFFKTASAREVRNLDDGNLLGFRTSFLLMTLSAAAPSPHETQLGAGRAFCLAAGMAMWTALFGGGIVPLLLAGNPPAAIRKVTRFWARGVLAMARRITRIDHVVDGKWPGGPCLILCNHQSAWETIAALVLFPDVAIVAKQELLKIPVFGWYLRHSPMIIIDRAAGPGSIRTMARATAAALNEGRSVLIYPQGTRREHDDPIRFKRGVEHLLRALAVPLVPVVHDAGRYWRRDRKRPGTIFVKILPALDGNAPPALLARRAEAAMNAARLEAAGESGALIETATDADAPRGAGGPDHTPEPWKGEQ